jgi:hypothetical protein
MAAGTLLTPCILDTQFTLNLTTKYPGCTQMPFTVKTRK